MGNFRVLYLFLFCVLVLLQRISFSQITDTTYYNQDWNEVNDSALADYYRILSLDNTGKSVGKVRDYFITGEIQWEGELVSLDPDIYNNYCVWYNKDGTYSEVNYFINGKQVAEIIEQKESGKSKITVDQLLNYFTDSLKIQFIDYERSAWLFYSLRKVH